MEPHQLRNRGLTDPDASDSRGGDSSLGFPSSAKAVNTHVIGGRYVQHAPRINVERRPAGPSCGRGVRPFQAQVRVMDTIEMPVKQAMVEALNQILELELAGVVKYTHYSLMVYGYNRIPIVSWLKGNATEGLMHAHKAGEMVTLLGGHPSLRIGPLLETQKHDIGDILRESLEHESMALKAYYELLALAENQSVLLEEYAREMIVLEEMHLDEVNKMLRRPGELEPFSS